MIYRTGKRGQPGILYANEQALEVLWQIGEVSENDEFGGLWVPSDVAKKVVRRFSKAILTNPFSLRTVKPLVKLRAELQKAIQKHGAVVIVDASPGRKLSEVKATIRHETHHFN
ncbi:MAG: hypothetical protein ACRD7E_21290, partial [Bryobacteraceae bacterium]